MLSPVLSIPNLAAPTAEAAIAALAKRLEEHGHVRTTFAAAALARERRSPTGLPFLPHAVALPHAEPEHVVAAAIAVATLSKPVRFRQMGSPQVQLDVSLVVMPALSHKEQAEGALARVIELLQDASVRRSLAAAASPEDLAAILARGFLP